jgi:hypothetical protein
LTSESLAETRKRAQQEKSEQAAAAREAEIGVYWREDSKRKNSLNVSRNMPIFFHGIDTGAQLLTRVTLHFGNGLSEGS